MIAARAADGLMSVAGYLAWEAAAAMRHEYVGGRVYAMAGGTNTHHEIASNTLGTLRVSVLLEQKRAAGGPGVWARGV